MIYAVTASSISFTAIEMPTATATPAAPPMPAASDAAATFAVIVDVSLAATLTPPVWITPPP